MGAVKGARLPQREHIGAVGKECRLAVVFDMRLSRFAGSVSKAVATDTGAAVESHRLANTGTIVHFSQSRYYKKYAP